MTTPVYHYCKHCNKQYKTKSSHTKHELSCLHNIEAETKKAAFIAELEQIPLIASNPFHLFTLLHAAYAGIGITLSWTRLPSRVDLTHKKHLSDFVNSKLPEIYPAITGTCRMEVEDTGFSDIFGFTPTRNPFWGGHHNFFYSFQYIESFAGETTIPLPLFPKMYNNYIQGAELEKQQLELYREEVERYLKEHSAAKQAYVYNDSEVNKVKRMRQRLEDMLAEMKKCETLANSNAEAAFSEAYPKLSPDISNHLINLDILVRIDATKAKALPRPVNLDKLSTKLETISTEFASIRIKYPEAYL